MKKRLRAIIVGAGHRAMFYASYAKEHPDELEIVGVADPSDLRREQAAKGFHLAPERCFSTAEALACKPKFADFVINGTMDHQHVPTSLPLLKAGYDMLLEKPFATSEEEMWRLVAAARQHKRKIAICHVLRHSPFYVAIRQKVIAGEIGEILNIQATEHVSYHHVAVAFVRGKWNKKSACHSSMLMAKSCHDLDLIAWMKSGVAPRRVSSFGSNFQFRPDKAPKGAGTRCLVDCSIEPECLYSARKHYIHHPQRWSFYVWDSIEHIGEPTIEDKIESLKRDNPYGRCVWKCDNDVVDHQSVVIEFEDGATATLNMIGGCSKPSRSLHLIGTTGEIQGRLEDSRFVIRHIDPRAGHEFSEEIVDLNVRGDTTGAFGGHGGGDLRLVSDFLCALRGEPTSISSTRIEDSISGHLVGFRADRAIEAHRVVEIDFEKGCPATEPSAPSDAR
ncbi:MAG: Gfo/Idh/MocA family oxidoreductase [Candidatus Latescibacteria bacterium]|nr:Gfo/Idh/MocA family oxidoreductase [Candidatus Latescibacterota bacterium]